MYLFERLIGGRFSQHWLVEQIGRGANEPRLWMPGLTTLTTIRRFNVIGLAMKTTPSTSKRSERNIPALGVSCSKAKQNIFVADRRKSLFKKC